MQVIKTSKDLTEWVQFHHSNNKTIGFVPTMGALHQGHISLINNAKQSTDLVVASIFINPLQFNNQEDFNNYPKTIDQDLEKLEKAGCNAVFLPDYHQIYDGYEIKDFDMQKLDLPMEGEFRPGHFNGMANVVMRFFEIVQPNKAFFGLKDYQQFIIVKTLAAQLFPHLEIIGVNTLRDENGLALSSRNLRLSEEEKKSATLVNQIIKKEIEQLKQGQSIADTISQLTQQVNQIPTLKTEYITITSGNTLENIQTYDEAAAPRLFIAFYAGNIRLIDNFSI